MDRHPGRFRTPRPRSPPDRDRTDDKRYDYDYRSSGSRRSAEHFDRPTWRSPHDAAPPRVPSYREDASGRFSERPYGYQPTITPSAREPSPHYTPSYRQLRDSPPRSSREVLPERTPYHSYPRAALPADSAHSRARQHPYHSTDGRERHHGYYPPDGAHSTAGGAHDREPPYREARRSSSPNHASRAWHEPPSSKRPRTDNYSTSAALRTSATRTKEEKEEGEAEEELLPRSPRLHARAEYTDDYTAGTSSATSRNTAKQFPLQHRAVDTSSHATLQRGPSSAGEPARDAAHSVSARPLQVSNGGSNDKREAVPVSDSRNTSASTTPIAAREGVITRGTVVDQAQRDAEDACCRRIVQRELAYLQARGSMELAALRMRIADVLVRSTSTKLAVSPVALPTVS